MYWRPSCSHPVPTTTHILVSPALALLRFLSFRETQIPCSTGNASASVIKAMANCLQAEGALTLPEQPRCSAPRDGADALWFVLVCPKCAPAAPGAAGAESLPRSGSLGILFHAPCGNKTWQ